MIPDLRSSSTPSEIGFYPGHLEERLTGGMQRTNGLMVRYEVVKVSRLLSRKFRVPGLCCSEWCSLQGFGLTDEQTATTVKLTYEGSEYSLSHGAVIIAAITSCTNTSNPSVMLGAGSIIHPTPHERGFKRS